MCSADTVGDVATGRAELRDNFSEKKTKVRWVMYLSRKSGMRVSDVGSAASSFERGSTVVAIKSSDRYCACSSCIIFLMPVLRKLPP